MRSRLRSMVCWRVLGGVLGFLAIGWAVASATVTCTPRGSLTTVLGLCLPADTETNWGNAIRGNFSALDDLFTGASLLKPLYGGTGINGSAAGNGKVLIGNGTGYTLANIQDGTGILVTNTAGGIKVESSGSPAGGSIFAAGALRGIGGTYTTTSVTYEDVDATNLKASVTVPGGAKFIIVQATFCVSGGTSTENIAHVRVLAAGSVAADGGSNDAVYVNNGALTPAGVFTFYGVVANPASGAQTIALQFRGDSIGTAFSIVNQIPEGVGPICLPRMLYQVTN